jgi:hypothetical protein
MLFPETWKQTGLLSTNPKLSWTNFKINQQNYFHAEKTKSTDTRQLKDDFDKHIPDPSLMTHVVVPPKISRLRHLIGLLSQDKAPGSSGFTIRHLKKPNK